MRFFVAVVPAEPAARELRSALVRLPDSGVEWTDPADWHMTLAFLGEVPDDRRPALSGALSTVAARTGPVRLHFAGGGHFDSRVLWAGVGGDVEGLHALSLATREAADNAHIGLDDRPFRPHLTLAHAWHRQRDEHGTITDSSHPPGTPDIQPLADALTDFASAPWHADRLLLMSVRSSRPPRYTTDESWFLNG